MFNRWRVSRTSSDPDTVAGTESLLLPSLSRARFSPTLGMAIP
jgi:hypothetical protein